MIIDLFILFFIATCISFSLTPLVILLAKKTGLVDNPNIRPHPAHTHKGIIPRAGGLPIYLGIFIPLFLIIKPSKHILGVFVAATILLLVGLWDDKKDRSPYVRLISNVIASLCAVIAGIGIPYITNPFGGILRLNSIIIPINFFGLHNIILIADIFALIWFVWMMNTIGWSGGVDGQMPGFVTITACIIGILSLRYVNNDPSQLIITYLSFITAGAFFGFLPWNFYPQKIMPGYGGKTIAGFMLAVLSILSYSKLGTALLILAVPTVDAVYLLLKRTLSGKSPVWASKGHLHHGLLNLGWGKRRVALFYWLMSLSAGLIALIVKPNQKVFAIVLVFVLIAGFIVLIDILQKIAKNRNID